MAFDFLGSFNKAQFERLKSFASDQRSDVAARLQHLSAEKDRIGTFSLVYDAGGIPTGHTSSATSYLGRLISAYEVLGGDIEYDLNVRSRGQPLFLMRTDETAPAQMFSDGSVMGSAGTADASSAILVQSMRSWMSDVLQYRREYLERKIRRMIDYVDQLDLEIAQLNTIMASEQADGSLDYLSSEVEILLNDPTYRATSNSGDVHNKRGGAPFASYDPGPEGSTANTFQRGFDGSTVPGDDA